MSSSRPRTGKNGRPIAEMTPTVTVCPRPKGLPMAITQSPAAIWLESPNEATGSSQSGRSTSSRSALSVNASRPRTRASYRSSSSSPKKSIRIDSAFSTTWLLVRIRPLRSMTNPVPAVGTGSARCRGWRRGCPKKRSNRSPPKKSFRSVVWRRDTTRMLTTMPVWAAAMSRNVVAPMSPVIGALFAGGICTACAEEAGVSSKRDASTMPMSMDAAAITTPENRVVLRVDIADSSTFPGATRGVAACCRPAGSRASTLPALGTDSSPGNRRLRLRFPPGRPADS